MVRDALNDAALDQLLRAARSHHKFSSEPISHALIRQIGELVKQGPTSNNQLPGRFTWCVSADAKARLSTCSMGGNAARILEAPATVIIAMDLAFPDHLPEFFLRPGVDRIRQRFADNPDLVRHSALLNTSLQAGYLILAARALGLDVAPMSGFDRPKVDEMFLRETPNLQSVVLVALGHGVPEALPLRLPRPDFDRFNKIL